MKWISVKDILPEPDQEVLVFNLKYGINLGKFDPEDIRGYYESDGSYFITNSGWEVHNHWAPYMGPSHWMPLPDAPAIYVED